MSFTQMKPHSLAKSKGTAMTDLVSPKLSWVYILSSMFNVSSMINDVAPKQPPTMAPCLQPINGTAQPTFCAFNQQRYGYHTSTMDAQCLANTITNSGKYSTSCATNSPGYGSYTHHSTCNLKSATDVQSLCADEVLESLQLQLYHGVRELYPAVMLHLHDDHSCPEPTYMKLHPTPIGNRRTIGDP